MEKIIYNQYILQQIIDCNLLDEINNKKVLSRVELLSKIVNVSENLKKVFYNKEIRYNKNEFLNNLDVLNNAKVKLSVNIMTYNEERCIKRCLDSIVDIADEIIILDTGSNDNTINIIKNYKYPIKLLSYSEKLDFAKCRNILMQNSNYDWIFYIDADEYLDPESKDIKSFISLFDNFKYTPLTISPKIVFHNNSEAILTKRIFNKKHNVIFYGSIHEYLKISNTNDSLKYHIMTNFTVNHDGYLPEIIKSKNKLERNIELLRDMVKKDSENIRWYYYLAREMFINHQNCTESIELLNLGLNVNNDIINDDIEFFRLISLILLCEIYYSLGDFNKIELTLNEIHKNFDDSTDYYFFYHILNYNKELSNILKLSNYTILNLKKLKLSDSVIHTQNYHILKSIGLSYITVENYDLAFRCFSKIKDESYIEEIKKILLNKKNNIENILNKLSE